MDVKSSFLHGYLFEKIYMNQPLSFVTNSNVVSWLEKALYGLKQSPSAWYEKIDHFFTNLGFKRYEYDHSIYVLHVDGDTLIFALYVDDLLISGNNVDLVMSLRNNFQIPLK